MAPDELGVDGREALQDALGHQAGLDVAMIGGELAPDGGAVSVGLAVEILVAVAAPNGAHVCHPKVIGPGAEGVEGLLEGDLDLEAQRIQPRIGENLSPCPLPSGEKAAGIQQASVELFDHENDRRRPPPEVSRQPWPMALNREL